MTCAEFAPARGHLRLWQSDYESPHTVDFDRRTLSAFLRRHGFEAVAHRSLADVPRGTALARLRFDPTTSRCLALLSVPAIYVVNLIERLRGKSDALLVIARVTSAPPQEAPASSRWRSRRKALNSLFDEEMSAKTLAFIRVRPEILLTIAPHRL